MVSWAARLLALLAGLRLGSLTVVCDDCRDTGAIVVDGADGAAKERQRRRAAGTRDERTARRWEIGARPEGGGDLKEMCGASRYLARDFVLHLRWITC